MKVQGFSYEPDIVLERARKLWLRTGSLLVPSNFDSEVDLGTHEVHLRNCDGLLATYRILPGGRLRRKTVRR